MTERQANKVIAVVWWSMLAATLLLLFAGCGSVRYVPVVEYRERYVHDTAYQTRWRERIDSVFVHDTTYIDTAGIVHTDRVESRKSKVESRDTVLKTVEVAKIDSVPYPVEVIREVPRERSGYDRFCSWAFWIAVAVVAVVIVGRVLWSKYGGSMRLLGWLKRLLG